MRGFAARLLTSATFGVMLGPAVGTATAAEWVPPAAITDTQIALRFERLDVDGDHALSAREVRPYASLTAAFDVLDSDGDRFLSLAEFRRAGTRPRILSEIFTF
jgi:hypothetical protein